MTKIIILITFVAFTTALRAETLKIASWNIAWLGSYKYNERTSSDYAELARYAKQLDADIIALQEVESSSWAKQVFGDDYDYYFSTKDWFQRVGYAVRKSIGFKVRSSEYKKLDVGQVRHGMDLILSKGEKKLRLLAVHLKSGCFDKPLNKKSIDAMPSSSKKTSNLKVACNLISNQIKPLESWIDARAEESVPFIVLGDFNRRFAVEIEKNYSETQGLWEAIDDDGAEDLWSPTLQRNSGCWGGYYKDYIDHLILDPKAKAAYVEDSFEQIVYEGKYSRRRSQNLSDHCPISVEITL